MEMALGAEETDFYEALLKKSQSKFNTYVKKGTLKSNYASILAMLVRLRQAVLHPSLVVHTSADDVEVDKRSVLDRVLDSDEGFVTSSKVCLSLWLFFYFLLTLALLLLVLLGGTQARGAEEGAEGDEGERPERKGHRLFSVHFVFGDG